MHFVTSIFWMFKHKSVTTQFNDITLLRAPFEGERVQDSESAKLSKKIKTTCDRTFPQTSNYYQRLYKFLQRHKQSANTQWMQLKIIFFGINATGLQQPCSVFERMCRYRLLVVNKPFVVQITGFTQDKTQACLILYFWLWSKYRNIILHCTILYYLKEETSIFNWDIKTQASFCRNNISNNNCLAVTFCCDAISKKQNDMYDATYDQLNHA